MSKSNKLSECPNCAASLEPGTDEFDFQECIYYGWPEPSFELIMTDDDDQEEGFDSDPFEEPDYDLEKFNA